MTVVPTPPPSGSEGSGVEAVPPPLLPDPHSADCGTLREGSASAPLPEPGSADSGTLHAGSPSTPPHQAEHAALRPSDRVGPYELLEVLGEGGMGIVYHAQQTEPVRRRVAIKVIKLGMDTEQVVARFESERQALAVMDHPGIAKVLDAGATESGRPYFVMELVKGDPITEFCDVRRLSTAERLRLFVDVCRAVQHAHQKGVIHRDLKPSNVLVTLQDGRPAARIIDFGLAKAVGRDLADGGAVTRAGQLLGTPAYMSPEQATFSGIDVDARTDVYSLGVTLYELLVGALPFDLEDVSPLAVGMVLRERETPRPSTRFSQLGQVSVEVAARRSDTPGGLSRKLRGDLEWILLKALEKDRARRYDTPAALAQDLERHLAGEPILARPPSAAYTLGKLVRRHRAAVALVAALALLLVVFTGTMTVQAGRIARERDRAELEAVKKAAALRFLEETILSPDPLDRLGPDATVMQALGFARERLEGMFSEEPEVDAAVRDAIGWAYFRLDRLDEAEPLLRQALALRAELLDPPHDDLAQSLHHMGVLYESRAIYDSAGAFFLRALEMRRAAKGSEGGGMPEVLLAYGGWLEREGSFQEAESHFQEARRVFEAQRVDEPALAEVMNRLGRLYLMMDRPGDAERELRRALEIRQASLGDGHALVAESLNNLASLLDDLERWDEAEALYRQALEAFGRIYGEKSEGVAAVTGNLALVLERSGRPDEAETMYRRQIGIDAELYGDGHPYVALDRMNLASLLCSGGRGAEGTEMLRGAERVVADAVGADHWQTATVSGALGTCLVELGRFDEAERRLTSAVATLEAALGPDHSRTARMKERLAKLYDRSGRPREGAAPSR